MYKIEIMDECGSTVDELESEHLEGAEALISDKIKEGTNPEFIIVYQEVKFSCDVTVHFED